MFPVQKADVERSCLLICYLRKVAAWFLLYKSVRNIYIEDKYTFR